MTPDAAAPAPESGTPTRYVCGFLFCGSRVLLIEKQRPDWQRGKWNGVGGRIEAGESDTEAMRREFREETGADVASWEHVVTLVTDHGSEVVFFRARVTRRPTIKQTTDERPEWFNAFGLPFTVPNLRWLVPLAYHESAATGMPLRISEAGAPNTLVAALTERATRAETALAEAHEMAAGILDRVKSGIGDVPRAWVIDNMDDIVTHLVALVSDTPTHTED